MNRLDILQYLINKINAKKYLEIGVQGGYVFDNILCEYKVGVDPDVNSKATIYSTSDDFFKKNLEKFDIIFIDGLHHDDQVYRDINNSLAILNSGGYIVCHDMNPTEEIFQRRPQEIEVWTGDCWKAWVTIRSERQDLSMFVVDTDWGCGVIHKGCQELLNVTCELNWNNFVLNRLKWLNLISIEDFKSL